MGQPCKTSCDRSKRRGHAKCKWSRPCKKQVVTKSKQDANGAAMPCKASCDKSKRRDHAKCKWSMSCKAKVQSFSSSCSIFCFAVFSASAAVASDDRDLIHPQKTNVLFFVSSTYFFFSSFGLFWTLASSVASLKRVFELFLASAAVKLASSSALSHQ